MDCFVLFCAIFFLAISTIKLIFFCSSFPLAYYAIELALNIHRATYFLYEIGPTSLLCDY